MDSEKVNFFQFQFSTLYRHTSEGLKLISGRLPLAHHKIKNSLGQCHRQLNAAVTVSHPTAPACCVGQSCRVDNITELTNVTLTKSTTVSLQVDVWTLPFALKQLLCMDLLYQR